MDWNLFFHSICSSLSPAKKYKFYIFDRIIHVIPFELDFMNTYQTGLFEKLKAPLECEQIN